MQFFILNNSEAFYRFAYKKIKYVEKNKHIYEKNQKEFEYYLQTRSGIIIKNKIYGIYEQSNY
jgi:hypothetical protein